MAVGLTEPDTLLPVAGVKLAACHSGIKADSAIDDLVLMELVAETNVAAVFTKNKFCAAPVVVARRHLENSPRYLLINSGNANAGTGEPGLQVALTSCGAVAEVTGCDPHEVLPFSTGVIGELLPVNKIQKAIPSLVSKLQEDSWLSAASGIMTTDTLPKAVSRQIDIDGQVITITGMCKGSGMIKPDMATMLAYVATDAEISRQNLTVCLQYAVDQSFNAITVDGDTSTNDACVLMATGSSRVTLDADNSLFMQALTEVFQQLAQSIVRDGEGATKFVEIRVDHARQAQDARDMAYTIAHSPLVKTALFASDANWGRILAAVGRAPIDKLDIDKVDLFLGNVCLIQKGLPHPSYSEDKGQQVMSKQDIKIRVDLNTGDESARVWTTDLSYDYVKINAEYRT